MDRLRFLNGQITNDLRKASETSAIEACVLSAKGKTNAHIFVCASGESFLVDAAADLREPLKARLERYVIADDVQIEDVTDQFALFHVLSQQSPAAESGRMVFVRRFAEPGWDIWIDAAQHAGLLQELSARSILCDSDAAEVMRIEQGIPRWDRELTEEIIPIEANLEQRAIDYQKGCYIGQEVISRIKMSGQTNKRLCGLLSMDDIPLQPGLKLLPPSAPGKEVGWITSATRSETIGKEIALGYVKRGFNNAGTKLAAASPSGGGLDVVTAGDSALKGSQSIRVEVVPLPFV
jgi:folate-binding protein YgfZ